MKYFVSFLIDMLFFIKLINFIFYFFFLDNFVFRICDNRIVEFLINECLGFRMILVFGGMILLIELSKLFGLGIRYCFKDCKICINFV